VIQILLALIASLGQSVGGKTGTLVTQLVNIINTGYQDTAEWKAFAGPWIKWVNAIIDADRDPTEEEHAAAVALADTVRARNHSLAVNGPPVTLPAPPASTDD
jgi:hypothetical protein